MNVKYLKSKNDILNLDKLILLYLIGANGPRVQCEQGNSYTCYTAEN